jgi:hypothetical protein
MNAVGKYILIIGIILAVIGVVLWLFGDKLGFLGHLPGDISIKREGFGLFFPVTSMILVSIVVSVIIWILRKFINF